MNVQIDTYWNVETLYYVFNAVAALMGGAGWKGALKFMFISGLMVWMFAQVNKKEFELGGWFLHAYIFVTILCLPIARVAIVDKTNLEPPRVVANVPWSLAVVGRTVNLATGWAADKYETLFSVPEELRLGQGDVGWGAQILKSVNNATIRDPELRADLIQFFKECTMYDLKDGAISANDIVNGSDVWTTIFNNTSPARFVTYNTLSGSPLTDTCQRVAKTIGNNLEARVRNAVVAAQSFYGRRAFSRAQNDGIAASMFMNAVGTSYDWILQSSLGSSEALRQAMFNNMWRDAGSELPALLNDPARVAEVQAMAGAAMAAKQSAGSNSVLALLGRDVLPVVRNWIEAILYAVFPLIVMLIVVSSPKQQRAILVGYMMTLTWIGLWPVLYAVVNHLHLLELRRMAEGLQLAGRGVPFQLSGVYEATLTDKQAMVGAMVVMVPFLSAAIVRMAQGQMMSLADRAIAFGTSSGAAAGAALAAGNFSSGRASVDSSMANTTAMHKFDTNTSLDSGMTGMRMADGGMVTSAAGGRMSISQMRNNLLTEVGGGTRFDSARTQGSHFGASASDGWQQGSRSFVSSSLGQSHGRDEGSGQYQNSGHQFGSNSDANFRQSAGGGYSLNRSALETSFFNQLSAASNQLSLGGGVSAGVGRGGTGGGGGAVPAMPRDMAAERRIQNGMQGQPEEAVTQAIAKMYADRAPGHVQQSTGRAAGFGGLNGSAGANFSKESSASNGRNSDWRVGADTNERNDADWTHASGWSSSHQGGFGDQSQQMNFRRSDAAWNEGDERFGARDTSFRRDSGFDQRAHRGESMHFDVRHDLMGDPAVWEETARRNDMSLSRFVMMNPARQREMIADYLADKPIYQQATAMPGNAFDGRPFARSEQDISSQARGYADAQPDPMLKSLHDERIQRSGYAGTDPVDTESLKSDVDKNIGQVSDYLIRHGQDIRQRGDGLEQSVHFNASPDREIGDGRRNTLGAANKILATSAVSTGGQILSGLEGLLPGDRSNDTHAGRRTDSGFGFDGPQAGQLPQAGAAASLPSPTRPDNEAIQDAPGRGEPALGAARGNAGDRANDGAASGLGFDGATVGQPPQAGAAAASPSPTRPGNEAIQDAPGRIEPALGAARGNVGDHANDGAAATGHHLPAAGSTTVSGYSGADVRDVSNSGAAADRSAAANAYVADLDAASSSSASSRRASSTEPPADNVQHPDAQRYVASPAGAGMLPDQRTATGQLSDSRPDLPNHDGNLQRDGQAAQRVSGADLSADRDVLQASTQRPYTTGQEEPRETRSSAAVHVDLAAGGTTSGANATPLQPQQERLRDGFGNSPVAGQTEAQPSSPVPDQSAFGRNSERSDSSQARKALRAAAELQPGKPDRRGAYSADPERDASDIQEQSPTARSGGEPGMLQDGAALQRSKG